MCTKKNRRSSGAAEEDDPTGDMAAHRRASGHVVRRPGVQGCGSSVGAMSRPGAGLRLGFIEPHLLRFGGIRRMVEFSNRLVARGHDVTIYLPDD